jgi:toxin YhaV
MSEIRINGWRIYLHPCFLDQYEALLAEVEAAKKKDPQSYRKRACTKMLAAVHELAFRRIPDNPSQPQYRLGDTLGKQHTHWFRAKFFQQYRLFFRFQESARIIIIAWVNDGDTKRAYGSKTDAYRVFARMLARRRPPDDWDALLAECRKSEIRAAKARSQSEGAI